MVRSRVVHGLGDDGATVETGGLLAAADLLVDALRRYRIPQFSGWRHQLVITVSCVVGVASLFTI